MGARNNAISSKKFDANEDLRCFLITVDKDGKNNSKKPDTGPRTSEDRFCISKSPPKVKPKINIPNVCMASLRQDSKETKDLHVGSGESSAALSMDTINMSMIQGLDEIQKAGSPPRFITVCNRVLANRPSFLILKDASAQNQTKEDLDYSDLRQSESSHAQQNTLPAVVSFSAGSQTDEICCQVDVASGNNSGHEDNGNAGAKQTPCIEEIRKEAESSSLQAKLQQHPPEIIQQQQQQPLANSPAPFVSISFTPLPQTGNLCGTSVAPCQQFPSAATSNASNCSFCTSNCCLPRPPQVCQMPKTTCCFPPNLGSCLLAPHGYPYCCCSRSISCWPVLSPQHQSSLGFPGHCQRGGMVVSNQISHLFQPVVSTTGFAPGGSFYSGINPCLGHCPMHMHHYPHCNCAGFLKSNQQQQQHLLQMGRRYPLQMGQPYQLQIGQLPQLGHHAPCVCSLNKQPNKALGPEARGDEGFNGDGLDHVVSKVPPPTRAPQPLSEDQDHQEQAVKGKSSTAAARAMGGAAQIKRNFNSTALYAARSGRTCLILRPTATAMVPRLLTRRISRYTSVIMAPK